MDQTNRHCKYNAQKHYGKREKAERLLLGREAFQLIIARFVVSLSKGVSRFGLLFRYQRV